MPAISGAEPSKVIKSFYALPFIGSLELEAKMAWQVTVSASDGGPACFQIFPVANEAMSQSPRRKKERKKKRKRKKVQQHGHVIQLPTAICWVT